MNLSGEQRFRCRDGVLTEQLDGELLLMDLDNDFLFALNEVGEIIWNGLGAGHSLGELVDALAGQFEDIDRAVLQQDTEDLLAELLQAQLIVPNADA